MEFGVVKRTTALEQRDRRGGIFPLVKIHSSEIVESSRVIGLNQPRENLEGLLLVLELGGTPKLVLVPEFRREQRNGSGTGFIGLVGLTLQELERHALGRPLDVGRVAGKPIAIARAMLALPELFGRGLSRLPLALRDFPRLLSLALSAFARLLGLPLSALARLLFSLLLLGFLSRSDSFLLLPPFCDDVAGYELELISRPRT